MVWDISIYMILHTFKDVTIQSKPPYQMCEKLPRIVLVRAIPKLFPHARNQWLGSSNFFNKFCTYKYIYTGIFLRLLATAICRCRFLLWNSGYLDEILFYTVGNYLI